MIYRVFDLETVCDDWTPPADDPDKFPPLAAHKIIALAMIDIELVPQVGGPALRLPAPARVFYGPGVEREALVAFGAECARLRPVLVTWNGRRFDAPLLAIRAMHHNVSWAWYYTQSPNYRYRFGEAHLDLYDNIGDHAGAIGGLDLMARLCGAPGKTGMVGADVAAAAAAGKYDDIATYCLENVFNTFVVLSRFQAARGAWPDAPPPPFDPFARAIRVRG